MKLKTKLLYMAAFLMLIVPLMLTGNASAVVYNPDGAVLNGTTGLWELPILTSYSGCFNGTASLDLTKTNRYDCRNIVISTTINKTTCTTATAITSPAGYAANVGVGSWVAGCDVAPATNISEAMCTAASGNWYSDGTMACNKYQSYPTRWPDQTSCEANGGLWGHFISGTTVGTGLCGGNWVFKNKDAYGVAGSEWGSSNRANCLKCHQPAYMDTATQNPAGQVSKYINASHKNASRKIVAGNGLANVYIDSAGVEQFGIFPYLPGLNNPNNTDPVYGTAGTKPGVMGDNTANPTYNFRRVDWVNGKIEDTTNAGPGWVGLRNLPTDVYTEWYWEFGYYGEDPERGVYNGAVGSNGKPSAKQQACFACHATNYEGSSSIDLTKEPAKSYPSIHWNGTTTYAPGSRPGVVNFITAMTDRATNVKTTTTYGKWDEFGVLCSRCHNSAGGSHVSGGTGAVNPTTAYTVNAVCGQCHVKASSSDYAVTAGTGVLTVRNQVGTGHPNYHETDFLNSPHARFTGTYGQISNSTMYNSAFMTSNAGCVGCHNPHGSVHEPLIELTEGTSAEPAEGIEKVCTDCHTDKDALNMKHPTTAGTPADEHDACVTCHMPNGRHLFRITTTPDYTNTKATASPAMPDGTFTEAVWMDLQTACGQCHGGGLGDTGATHNGAPYMKRSHLAVYANGIHNSTNAAPTASFTSGQSGLTLTLTDTSLDDAVLPVNAVTVLWGDGSSSTANAGSAIPHTYATAGTFKITYKVKDAEGLYGYVLGTSATVSTNLTIAVTLSPAIPDKEDNAAIGGDDDGICEDGESCLPNPAKIVLKRKGPYGWSTKAVFSTPSGTTFTIKKLGIFRIKVVKSGYAFDCDAGTAGNQSYIDVTMGGSTSVTCTHTP